MRKFSPDLFKHILPVTYYNHIQRVLLQNSLREWESVDIRDAFAKDLKIRFR